MAESCVCDHVDIGIGLMKVNDDPSCRACHPLGCNCGCQPVEVPEPSDRDYAAATGGGTEGTA